MPDIPSTPGPKKPDSLASSRSQQTTKTRMDALVQLEQTKAKVARLAQYLAIAKGEQSKAVTGLKREHDSLASSRSKTADQPPTEAITGLKREHDSLASSRSKTADQPPTEAVTGLKREHDSLASSRSKTTAPPPTKPSTTDVKYEIEYLLKLIAFLEKHLGKDPAVAKELSKDKALVKKLQNDFPHLSEKDLKQLESIMSKVNTLSNKLDDSDKSAFIKIEIDMFQAMSGENSKIVKELEKKLQSYDDLAQAVKEIKELEKFLAYLGSGSRLTPLQLEKLVTDIKNLLTQLPNLPKGIQGKIKSALNFLSSLQSKLPNGKSFSFANLIADMQFNNWVQEYNSTAKPPTKAGLKAFLENKIKEFSKNASNTVLTQKMIKEFTANLSSYPTPADGQGMLGPFGSSNFGILITYAISLSSYGQDPSGRMEYALNAITAFIETSGPQIGEWKKEISEYEGLNNIYKAAIKNLEIKRMWSSSLQSAFYQAILNHYMPGQEKYLQELANLLNLSNFGAQMDNLIISNLVGFSNASNDFSFSNWLKAHSMGTKTVYVKEHGKWVKEQETVYSGSGNTVLNKPKGLIPNEEGKVNKDIKNAQDAIGNINSKESEIENEIREGKLSPAQGRKLLNELQGYKAHLTTAISNLRKLRTALKSIKLHPVYDKDHNKVPNEFYISGDNTSVSELENTLVNGTAANGGLLSISENLNAAQQSWSSQSQTNQMQLQLVMTEIQQEWAVVATALSQLNQIYLTVSRGIGGK